MTDLLENRIPQLLARVDLGELVTRLGGIETNRGTYHRPNPSHEDRNPSFTVKDSRWKCWSVCAAAGDAIDLLVWLKGCTKAEAIDELAALVGHERPGVPGYSGTAGSRSRLVEWCARRGWGPRVKPGELRHLHPNWGWKRYASKDRASRSDGEGIMVHPTGYEPMLATTSGQLEGEGWAFEPKLDGWRAGVHIHAGGVAVYSRPGRDVTEDVPQLAALVGVVPEGTVLDGELVAGSGRASSFYQLCPQLSTERAAVTFAAFDLLAVGVTIHVLRRPEAASTGCR